MDNITYKGVEYPTRTLSVSIDGTEQDITIATESLQKALFTEKGYEGDLAELEENIDNQIYFYVEDAVIGLDANEICEKHLDVAMEFLEEDGE